jgi:hypothetical protein
MKGTIGRRTVWPGPDGRQPVCLPPPKAFESLPAAEKVFDPT